MGDGIEQRGRGARWIERLVLLIAGAAALTLATRVQSTEDLGYHLAYGQTFWQSGRIVDDASFVHPVPAAGETDPARLPPGAWFDDAGRYRFVNANWLSQVLMSLTWRMGGGVALSALAVALLALALWAQAGALRERGVGWAMIGLAWLATALVADERLNLRPELFAFVAMAALLWLLAGALSGRRCVAAVAIQLLLVNLHGSWPLGLALGATMAAGAGLRWIVFAGDRADLAPRLRRFAVLLPAFAAVSVVHPATWRNALMPWQTLAYLDRYSIIGRESVTVSDLAGGLHPWATVGELRATLAGVDDAIAPAAFVALVAAAIVASVGLLIGRRWGWLLAAGLFAAVGFGMRRNIAPAALGLAPAAALGLHLLGQALRRRGGAAAATIGGRGAVAALVIVGGSAVLAGVVTQRWYVAQRVPWRLGLGLDATRLHRDAGRWMSRNLPDRHAVFTTFDNSSAALFASRRVSAVPLLTNTWAQPPARMTRVLGAGLDAARGAALLDEWGYDLALLPWRRQTTRGLIVKLSRDPRWAVVWLGPRAVLFARVGPLEDLVRAHRLTGRALAVEPLLAAARSADPAGHTALLDTAGLLEALGWYEPAVTAWRAVLDAMPRSIEAHERLAYCLMRLALRQRKAGNAQWQRLNDEAKRLDEARQQLTAPPDPFE